MRGVLFAILLGVCSISCKSVEISNQKNKVANSVVEIGTIGEAFFDYTQNIFETKAIPYLNCKIRISKEFFQFNKSTYKAYLNACKSQGGNNKIEYVDSLDVKPQYVNLRIVDKVSYLQELNAPYNDSNLDLIKVDPETKLVTSVSMVIDHSKLDLLKEVDEIYLVNGKNRKYMLELFKNHELLGEMSIDEGVIFSYSLASFCWGEDERYNTVLKNYVNNNSKCKNNTFKDFEKAEVRSRRLTFDDFKFENL